MPDSGAELTQNICFGFSAKIDKLGGKPSRRGVLREGQRRKSGKLLRSRYEKCQGAVTAASAALKN